MKNQMLTAIAMSIWPIDRLNSMFHKKTKNETAKRQSKTYLGGAHLKHLGSDASPQWTSFHTKPVGHSPLHCPGMPSVHESSVHASQIAHEAVVPYASAYVEKPPVDTQPSVGHSP